MYAKQASRLSLSPVIPYPKQALPPADRNKYEVCHGAFYDIRTGMFALYSFRIFCMTMGRSSQYKWNYCEERVRVFLLKPSRRSPLP